MIGPLLTDGTGLVNPAYRSQPFGENSLIANAAIEYVEAMVASNLWMITAQSCLLAPSIPTPGEIDRQVRLISFLLFIYILNTKYPNSFPESYWAIKNNFNTAYSFVNRGYEIKEAEYPELFSHFPFSKESAGSRQYIQGMMTMAGVAYYNVSLADKILQQFQLATHFWFLFPDTKPLNMES